MAGSGSEDSGTPGQLPITTDTVADAEIEEAALYYERERIGLGYEFLVEVNRTFGHVEMFPESYPLERGALHRANLRRFPYAIMYRVYPDCILIVGCVHGKRHPRTWEERA